MRIPWSISRIYRVVLRDWYNWKLCPAWDRFIHSKKCSCGHPLWMHICYEHGTCIHGVCLAETLMHYEGDNTCCCDGFNSMWNKEYPPNKPELRKTDSREGST